MKYIIFILLFISQSVRAMTLSTLQSDCRVLVKDNSNTTRQRFSDATLLRFINEAQKDIVEYAKPIRRSFQFELVSGTTYYSMPSDFIAPIRLSRSFLVLQEKSVAALDVNQQWEVVGGLPVNYFVNHSSRTLIGFYPWPNSTNSTGTIRVEYSAQPTDLINPTDQPFNGITEMQGYGYLLPLWCGYRASIIDQQAGQGQAYYAEYQRGVQMLSSDAFSRPNYKPGAMGGTSGGGP